VTGRGLHDASHLRGGLLAASFIQVVPRGRIIWLPVPRLLSSLLTPLTNPSRSGASKFRTAFYVLLGHETTPLHPERRCFWSRSPPAPPTAATSFGPAGSSTSFQGCFFGRCRSPPSRERSSERSPEGILCTKTTAKWPAGRSPVPAKTSQAVREGVSEILCVGGWLSVSQPVVCVNRSS
jgi:hypothetical protein